MSKSRQSRESARALIKPLFAFNEAVLKSGEWMLDSMAAAARKAGSIRVAVLDTEAPRAPARKSRASGRKAKRARSRR